MESWTAGLDFETTGPFRRLVKRLFVNALANYLPAGIVKAMLRFGKSELAAANRADPGGWKSMVISYNGRPRQIADKILVGLGTVPGALRNRRKLATRIIARLIDQCDPQPARVLCLGAGPGCIIIDAMSQARRRSCATLIDLSPGAFEYGRNLASQAGLADRVKFILGDVRDVDRLMDEPPHIVKMIGILEYLSDEQSRSALQAASKIMPRGSSIVCNSLSQAHGTDRFFRRVFGLHMIHRSPQEVQALLSAAGMTDFVSIPEPLGVYHVILARKGP